MTSSLTLKLDEETKERITRIASRERLSAPEVIRCAIASWVEQHEAAAPPYALMEDLIGAAHGGDPQRSVRTSRRVKEMLEKKAERK